ncbi:MAG: hypothetical protein ABI629_08520 [bacterium]
MPRRSVALAIMLALALLTAPMRGALRPTCDLCPPDCPMHREHGDKPKCHGDKGAAALHCHNALGVRDAEHGKHPRLSRPPCGNHGAIQGLALAPMILPEAIRCQLAPRLAAPRIAAPAQPRRGADPPDTPPPILSV